MKDKKNLSIASTLFLVGTFAMAQTPEPAPSIPDKDFSLRGSDAFAPSQPPLVTENSTSPGDGPLVPRAHAEAPPPIPHGITDFLPISAADNLCIDCHQTDEKVDGEPTPLPESHFVDLRDAPEGVQDEVAGARYLCISCHVAQTEAAPLRGNSAVAEPAE